MTIDTIPEDLQGFNSNNFSPMNVQSKSMSRRTAAGIHLGISAIIAVGVILLLYFAWYPQPFFTASGGDFLIQLLVGVDVILGPLITLIIFDTKKKSLKFDLVVIAVIQAAALCYGVYTMFVARPVFVAFSENRFVVVTAAEIQPKMLSLARTDLQDLSLSGPKYVFNNAPKENEDLTTLMLSSQGMAPQYYVPYREKSAEAALVGRPLSEFLIRHPKEKEIVQMALTRSGKRNNEVVYLPMAAKAMVLTVIVGAKDGEIIIILPVMP